MPNRNSRPRSSWLLLVVALTACKRQEASSNSTFYSRKISPFLEQSCATSPTRSSCHVVADERGNALGNLSVESYQNLANRRDLLLNYGPYGIPGLLLKVVPNYEIYLTSYASNTPTLITTDIAHAGNRLVDFASPSFTTLQKWMAGGANENNAPVETRAVPQGGCSSTLGIDPLFDADTDPTSSDFALFEGQVNSFLGERCAAGNCHGSPANSLHLTCGKTREELRWNYFAAGDYVSTDPAASEILRRTLSPTAGGTYHEGGAFFDTVDDPAYQALLNWAKEKGGPSHVPSDAGFEFFATRVQPMLVKRGCMMLGCHSAAMFHDYRLRGGSGGHFGLPATRKNYELSLEQVALESADPNVSRLVRKNLSPVNGGILHRGGALFAAYGRPEDCNLADADSGPIDAQSPYCVIVSWIAKERAARLGTSGVLSGIAYVKRTTPRPGLDAVQDWESFAPGADVVRVTATPGAGGAISVGAETSLSRQCGLDPTTSDARRPAVSWDGTRVAFSARKSASEPYKIFIADAAGCALDSAIDQGSSGAGELIHNLDPAFAPDGSIVFVSTRGNLVARGDYAPAGPLRTPSDPAKLNTNLYVREAAGGVRQLTFLLNQEMLPAFMHDGRVILSAEKRAFDFYQLAGRRINLDGGDYHPLFGQRSSIGFNQLTNVVELSDKNFAAILSDRGAAHGAGTLVVINRSIGIDQRSDKPEDYLVDPSAIEYPNPAFYQHSMHLVDPAATGHLDATQGAYAWPSPLPDGRILVSYAGNVVNLASFSGDFDVAVVDPLTGARTPLITGAGDALWPVGIYPRGNLGVFRSRLDEANGATRIDPDRGDSAEVTYIDLPLLTSLLFQNTRSGRDFPTTPQAVQLWQNLPPEPGVTSFANGGQFVTNDRYGQLYVRRSLLGQVTPLGDGSAKLIVPGGVPVSLATDVALAGETSPSLHFQREEIQFYPGEVVRQSFRRDFFNGLCGGCHGSVSGLEDQVAANPDILTQASVVAARDFVTADVSAQGGPPQGPDFP